MNEFPKNKNLKCSFCGAGENEAEKLIAGQKAIICDKCVENCILIIFKEMRKDFANRRQMLNKINNTAFNELWGSD